MRMYNSEGWPGMAENEDWEDTDDTPEGNTGEKTPKGLRAHAKAVDEENKQLKAQLAEFENAARKSRVEKAVAAKGFDPAVADVVPADVAKDEAALEKWLVDKEKLFAKVKSEGDQTVDQGFGEETLDEDRDGYMRISQVSSSALPASKASDLRSAIANAKTREEMAEILRKQGNQLVS